MQVCDSCRAQHRIPIYHSIHQSRQTEGPLPQHIISYSYEYSYEYEYLICCVLGLVRYSYHPPGPAWSRQPVRYSYCTRTVMRVRTGGTVREDSLGTKVTNYKLVTQARLARMHTRTRTVKRRETSARNRHLFGSFQNFPYLLLAETAADACAGATSTRTSMSNVTISMSTVALYVLKPIIRGVKPRQRHHYNWLLLLFCQLALDAIN